ncbi:MAG: 4-hydroxythreonine-4-phosphate dehydrogenase PdxA [Gammaproteobacteria bacterium]
MSAQRQRIALTTGEPAGIGPDICIQLAQSAHAVDLIAIGDAELLLARARALQMPLIVTPYNRSESNLQQAGQLRVLSLKASAPVRTGSPDPANSRYVLDSLDRAVDGCLSGEFDAMVTAPVHKGVINEAGIPFTGHTEYLAARCKSRAPVMLLATNSLRVALATTHLPLSQVPSAISQAMLMRTLRTLHADLQKRFDIQQPHILVLGLNPHAGEGGHLGREEIEIITPALEALRTQNMHLTGPVAADTAFSTEHLMGVDAVLAMYHDQGLPVLKQAGFGQAVNITLGLPIIRTSVDHGTALELAGTGRAKHTSLEAALRMAVELSQRK